MATMLEFLEELQPPLSKNLVEELRSVIKTKEVYKLYMWLDEDDISNALAFIEKGLFKRFANSQEGKEICMAFYKESEWFTSRSFFDQEASIETIQAIEDSRVHYIRHNDYERLCKQYPEFNKVALKVITMMTISNELRIEEYSMLKPYERYLKFVHTTPDLLLRISSVDLCSYLDIDEKTLQTFKYGNP